MGVLNYPFFDASLDTCCDGLTHWPDKCCDGLMRWPSMSFSSHCLDAVASKPVQLGEKMSLGLSGHTADGISRWNSVHGG